MVLQTIKLRLKVAHVLVKYLYVLSTLCAGSAASLRFVVTEAAGRTGWSNVAIAV